MKDQHFFAMLSRMKYINRWGLMRNTITENISEHSLDVAFIAHALGVINNTYFDKSLNPERLAVLGMFHDVTEIITGDMPTPVKYYNPFIRNAYKEVERVARDEMLSGLLEDMQEQYKPLLLETKEEEHLWQYVKAADKISALIKCIEEKRMGNMDFNEAEKSIKQIIDEMELPEVKYFVDNYLEAYYKTIDESK
ncbi:MAG: 5'-deoxynucleotidase [Lachnospiraceae bacterium]|nr:5'-deoxynucleotidase [Lachnospira sp.]MBQ8729809.1 5'-deoxynucleotidase [Lachnospiraceae bacterium]